MPAFLMSNMFSPARLLGATLMVGLIVLAPPSPGHAQTTPDQVTLVNLATRRAGPQAGPGGIGFELVVGYELRSTPSGYLKIKLLEDRGSATIEITKQPIGVEAGAARLGLELDYTAPANVESVQLVGELYDHKGGLLDSFSTIPLIIPRGHGREQFETGIAARDAGDWGRAAGLFAEAIRIAPDRGPYYYWHADALVRLEQYAEAERSYTEALALMPDDRASRVGRGVARVWLQAWQPALDDLNVVIDSQTNADHWTAWAHRARGLVYAGLGESGQARAEYQAYLGLRSNAPDRALVEQWIAALP